jgi:hypothetical protein
VDAAAASFALRAGAQVAALASKTGVDEQGQLLTTFN